MHIILIRPLATSLCAYFLTLLLAFQHLQILFGVNQRLRVEEIDSPLVSIRPVKTVLLVIVTGDRGLCGGYNNLIIKKVSCERWHLDLPNKIIGQSSLMGI